MEVSGRDYRRWLIRFFTFVGGLYFFFEYVTPEAKLEEWGLKGSNEAIINGFVVIGVMAFGLGIFNLLLVHGTKIGFRRPGWINSTALLGSLFAMIAVTVGSWVQGLILSGEGRQPQMLSSFAKRISDDAQKAVSGVPSLDVRLKSLNRATTEEIQSIQSRRLRIVNEGFVGEVFLSDLDKAVAEFDRGNQLVAALPTDSFTEQHITALSEFSKLSNATGVVYGALLRKHGESALVQRAYNLLYGGLFIPLGSAIFALLGIYIASAAFRAFRVRSVESALMMSAAVLVMLGQIPVGAWIYEGMPGFGRLLLDLPQGLAEPLLLFLYEGLPGIRQWLLEVPNSAAFRAIRVGAAIGGLMLAVRMWLSIESTSFSRKP
jgi:hypothetical protein